MKIQSVAIHSVLGAALVLGGAAVSASAQGTFVTRVSPPQRTATPVPSSPILPMTNPVAPMTNPVSPVVPSPFIRYGGTTPTVVVPDSNRGGGRGSGGGIGGRPGDGRGNRGRDYVAVPVPTYYSPYPNSYDYYPGTLYPPPTIPGRLPGERYGERLEDNTGQTSFNPNPNAIAPAPASPFVYEPQPLFYPEPRMIVREPQPNRVIQPPAAGTSRSDVILRLGQPWGSFTSRGNETLYFDGGLVVVLGPDGRVSQVR